jgi:transcription factor E
MALRRAVGKRRSIAELYKNKAKQKPSPLNHHFNDYVAQVATPQGLRVLQSIGESATDETIEEKTKYKMANIRALLNVLHKHGFINYTREKNLANGWFTYTWRFDVDRAMQNFFTAKRRELEQLHAKRAAEDGAMIYKCRKGCARLAFDAASEAAFRCPKCNSKLAWFDNARELRDIEQRIATIEKILANQNGANTA